MVIFVIVAYILYFIYDYNSVRWNNIILQKLFAIGTILLGISTIVEVVLCWKPINLASVLAFIGIIIFTSLLIYTLFFALPFHETYVEENKLRKTYTKGMYSLCRHPGVLWLSGVYICLIFISMDFHATIFYLAAIIGDVIYIIYQDIYIFPKTFYDYEDYKKTTPFLIPGIKHKK